MSPIDALFTVESETVVDGGFSAVVRLNPDHPVFGAHFPGYPVTPAAIQLQLVNALLNAHTGRPNRMYTLSQAKFLHVLNPLVHPLVEVHVRFTASGDRIQAEARGEREGVVFFRIQAEYGE